MSFSTLHFNVFLGGPVIRAVKYCFRKRLLLPNPGSADHLELRFGWARNPVYAVSLGQTILENGEGKEESQAFLEYLNKLPEAKLDGFS